ncbi:MAG: tetratricopeptide repeat protein [Chitinophagales bacterium]|nr:tetratricopeptide repeat protein [Chitinophagales bacterium]MDW8428813.1 tetratricopeptide repeat protein [Chitinophagales bacterium]
MKLKHGLFLAAAAALTAVLFLFADTIPPPPEPANQAIESIDQPQVEASTIIEAAQKLLPEGPAEEVRQKELALRRARNDQQRAALLADLAKSWEQIGHPVLAGHYYEEAYRMYPERKWLEQAAELYFVGFSLASDSTTRLFGAQRAAAAYHQLYDLDSTRLEYRIREATSYIDGLGNVMQGVMLLREVEAIDPDHAQVNVILGRLGVLSGQYDKAIARLEKVTRNDPKHAEAYFHLAQAYRAVGRTNDAIAAFERVRDLVDDPEFDAQLNHLIEQIKKR